MSESKGIFGDVYGYIVLKNVDCVGNETTLLNCSYDSDIDCNHSSDVGVICPCAGKYTFISMYMCVCMYLYLYLCLVLYQGGMTAWW